MSHFRFPASDEIATFFPLRLSDHSSNQESRGPARFGHPGTVMISIVLYGRNDNYGYNLHKRAALSLNCMAEVLTDPADEILFVDYNTPDDFPTFPEAIQDTLTKRAREMLRILRVRPRIHERFKSRTRLLALEPIARNVAVRRSSPSNRWILSTNTDMIFVPKGRSSLSQIAHGLPPGFYHAPRIEIPEVLWESFDRSAPTNIIRTVREWGTALHLNEIVLGSKFIRYDGPGDFQLLLRSDLFENDGFDEDMLLGWHVDSNIAARMLCKYEEVGDLGEHVYGYHCDHTRQVTPAHSHERVQNDWKRFVTEVARPDVPGQAASWGCAGDPVEEVRLAANPASVYVQALRDVIGDPLAAPKVVTYTGETYNKVDYDPRHLMPFLADMFVSMPRTFNLAWYGAREETLRLFGGIWERLSFTGRILFDEPLLEQYHTTSIHHVSTPEILNEADVFLFDFGGLPSSARGSSATDHVEGELRRSFRRIVRDERRRLSSGVAARRLIALNAINNEYERFVCGFVAAAATPFATRMRHGFVLPPSTAREDWLPLLAIGEAGIRVGDQVRNDPTKLGWTVYGPFKYLETGTYLATVKIELLEDEPDRPRDEPCILVEVVAGPELVGVHLVKRWELKCTEHRFTIVVSEDVSDGVAGIETRIRMLSPIGIAIRALTVEPVSASINSDEKIAAALTISDLLRIDDWLPFLHVGELGRTDVSGVNAEIGPAAFVVSGPYWSLPAGKYEMIAHIERRHQVPIPEHSVRADVVFGEREIVAATFKLTAIRYDDESGVLRLPFALNDQASEQRQVQTRIWSSGEERFRIRSLAIAPVERSQREDLLPFFLTGEAGLRVDGTIRNFDKWIGLVAYSPTMALEPGGYRLAFQLRIQTDRQTPLAAGKACAIVLVKNGSHILAVEKIKSLGNHDEDHELIFKLPPALAATGGIEFLLQVITVADVTLHALSLESVDIEVRHGGPVACEVENWLPFLQTKPSAHADCDGVAVSEGRAEYSVYGPYWTLPAGRYEVVALVVPYSSRANGTPVIIVDVSAEGGERQFAKRQWRLGRYELADAHTAAQIRLPFTLTRDLSPESRTIETRIFTQGEAGFRIRSLAVKVRSEEPEKDWFPYLAAGECGIHTGREIKSVANEVGRVAYTPPMDIPPGHYELFLNFADVSANDTELSPEDSITIEMYSESTILAVQSCKPERNAGSDFRMTFDVTDETALGTGVELFIRATAPAAISIRGVRVERTSNKNAASRSAAMPLAKDRLSYLHVGAAGLQTKRGIRARPGKAGNIGHIRHPFPPGRYEAILKVERVENGEPGGQMTITAGSILLVSQRIEFTPRRLGPFRIPRGPFRICSFEVSAHLPREARGIQIRIDSDGAGGFLIRAMVVKRKTPIGDLRDNVYAAAAKIFRKIQRALESH